MKAALSLLSVLFLAGCANMPPPNYGAIGAGLAGAQNAVYQQQAIHAYNARTNAMRYPQQIHHSGTLQHNVYHY